MLAGVLLSLAAFALALYGIHRLTTLELARRPRLGHAAAGPRPPRLAVMALAFAPMAFFFSAVYSESLYLALSVACSGAPVRDAGRWSACSARSPAATRSTGLVLLLPALMLYLYGPREDRAPDRVPARAARRGPAGGSGRPASALPAAPRRAVARC